MVDESGYEWGKDFINMVDIWTCFNSQKCSSKKQVTPLSIIIHFLPNICSLMLFCGSRDLISLKTFDWYQMSKQEPISPISQLCFHPFIHLKIFVENYYISCCILSTGDTMIQKTSKPTFTISFQNCTGVSSQCSKLRKRNFNNIRIGKK